MPLALARGIFVLIKGDRSLNGCEKVEVAVTQNCVILDSSGEGDAA
jgi:hypothetical protein